MSEVTKEKQEVKPKKANPFIVFFTRVLPVILAAVLAAGGVYFLAKKKPEVLGLMIVDPEQQETLSLVHDLQKIMDLPNDEFPTVATITDVDKLKDQSFFKNVQPGDKLLVYPKAKKSILYRPSEKRIIDVGIANINQNPSPVPATPSETPVAQTFRIALFNGTETVGATKDIETKITTDFKSAQIVARAVASKTDYTQTIVVDLVGNRAEDSKKIAEDLGIAVSTLPTGEKNPDGADFLVIVGSDKLQTASPSATPKAP